MKEKTKIESPVYKIGTLRASRFVPDHESHQQTEAQVVPHSIERSIVEVLMKYLA